MVKKKKEIIVALLNALFFVMLTFFFAACEKEAYNPEIHGLELSIGENVTTDGITYEFDVVDSYGKFTVEVIPRYNFASPKLTIDGRHVSVELIDEVTYLKIKDEGGGEKNVQIHSSNENLQYVSYLIAEQYGAIHRHPDIRVGIGKMRVLRGNSPDAAAEMSISHDNVITIKSRFPGTAFFYVADSRGTVRFFQVSVHDGCDITKPVTEIEAKADKILQFAIKYGKGGWKLKEEAVESPLNVIHHAGEDAYFTYEQDFLQLYVPKEATGSVRYTIEDREGLEAEIRIKIKENK